MAQIEQTCGACGDAFESDPEKNMPDPRSADLEHFFEQYVWLDGINHEFWGASHPLCPDCLIVWMHNLFKLSDGEQRLSGPGGSRPVEVPDPRIEQIGKLFERPEQFLSFLSGRNPNEVIGATLLSEVKKACDNPLFQAMTTYLQDQTGNRRGYVTYSPGNGLVWKEPDRDLIALPDWVIRMWNNIDGDVYDERAPVYTLQRAVADWIESVKAEEAQPVT